jgi:two-component system, NtrC family, sensor kinase
MRLRQLLPAHWFPAGFVSSSNTGEPFHHDRMRTPLYRPVQLAALSFVVLLLLALAILGGLNWRTLQRLEQIRTTADHVHDIQRVVFTMQRLLLDDMSGASPLETEKLREVTEELDQVVIPAADLSDVTDAKLREALRSLTSAELGLRPSLQSAIGQAREALTEETRAESERLRDIIRDTRTEVQLAAAALILLPALLLLAIWLSRQRIFRPIDNLKELLLGLAHGRFAPVKLNHVDSLVLPLFENYNQMVARLQDLEGTHERHEASLQAEVRAATRSLLQQQRSLARAERLAAIGELSAAMAHELRNPLAGIQMTLANLRSDLSDPNVSERLDLVIAEIQRITRLANDLLAQSRHVPEAKRWVKLAPLVRELLQLIRYQISSQITLQAEVPDDLECYVAEDGLRQALLNLILNAVQALGNSAGTIALEATMNQNMAHIVVRDDGAGFPEALLAGGIRPFVSSRESGTGLGLAVVRRFARDANGELRLSNLKPGGARAELILPCGNHGR